MKLNNSRALQPLFLVLSLFILLAGMPARATLIQRRSTMKTETALVAVVSRADPGEPQRNMDAVVLVENGKLKQPYPENNEAAQKKFAADYFAPGRKYRVTFGGGEVGMATVDSSALGCNNIHAAATVADGQKIPAQLSALATNSTMMGKQAARRRAPTDAERAAVMLMVREIYRTRGTSAALLNKLQTTNLTATDLNGDGAFELIGSFVIESKPVAARKGRRANRINVATGNARRDLLLIAEPLRLRESPTTITSAPSFKAALVEFQSYNMPPEGFDSAVDFVDQLDLDSDGVGEVFVRQGGFDAYGYGIYKKTARGWREVYTTTGDAC